MVVEPVSEAYFTFDQPQHTTYSQDKFGWVYLNAGVGSTEVKGYRLSSTETTHKLAYTETIPNSYSHIVYHNQNCILLFSISTSKFMLLRDPYVTGFSSIHIDLTSTIHSLPSDKERFTVSNDCSRLSVDTYIFEYDSATSSYKVLANDFANLLWSNADPTLTYINVPSTNSLWKFNPTTKLY